ncbi:MAG: 1-acyl-sn-glycerol-3-phosphate acyltransferase [Elusimicrobia bacterium]|nr:1-acyl-sn-glycerol-3-phosphate acyltransferase [Elusimicrobiota bacterium]MDE2425836.1 1-acyl-sn-glycerol-3-phosphate acyltransferase [Elusimicrobiota bacterium]
MGAEWERAPRLRRWPNALLDAFLRLACGVDVEGLAHLPETGPAIIAAAPHTAYLDGPLLAVAAAPRRCVWALTKAEVFKVPVLGRFLRRVGTIALDRRGDLKAMRAALELLENGGCLLVFPEGTRSKAGAPGRAKAGVGFLAARSRAPVVPARLLGVARFPRERLGVRFGAPQRLADGDADRDACQRFADGIMARAILL